MSGLDTVASYRGRSVGHRGGLSISWALGRLNVVRSCLIFVAPRIWRQLQVFFENLFTPDQGRSETRERPGQVNILAHRPG